MKTTELYRNFGWNYTDNKKYQQTWNEQHSKYSNESYSFKIDGLDNSEIKNKSKEDYAGTCELISDRIMKEFNIKEDIFGRKLEMSCSGSGEEIQKITALHSSSLCALLFFYDVEKNPLTLHIDGKPIKFSKSFFEWKNPVFGSDSNIDVALYSEESNALLFLESKFSEFLHVKAKLDIPYKYAEDSIAREVYEELCNLGDYKTTFEKFTVRKNRNYTNVFYLECSKDKHYIDGIKQMISHYLGVIHFLDGQSSEKDRYEKEISINGMTKYYLGEIVFDTKIPELEDYCNDYITEYNKLESILKEDLSKRGINNFRVLPNVLLYSDLEKYILNCNEKIHNYYFFRS